MTPSDISPEGAIYYAVFEQLNWSDLYQLARRNKYPVLPSYSRDALIRIIILEVEAPPIAEHTFDEWRKAIMLFLIDHRRALETQLTCPAKTFKPDACFGCVDAQVVSCLVDNASSKHLIQLHLRKPHG